jgi:hypothetical protein
MRIFLIWFLAFLITICAAYYQRKTGPTYPKSINITLNGKEYTLKLTRSLGLDDRPEIKLGITDTTISAKLYFKRFKTNDDYRESDFKYKVYPVKSFIMNRIFKITEEKGFFAEVPKQPAAGKLQYYMGLTGSKGTITILKETPVIIRFKGTVPGLILAPHILFMFLAMFFSTLAGLMSIAKLPRYKRYSVWTLILLLAGGFILGPLVQNFAFGEWWTGVPFGWDLTDNKTLIAILFWVIAVIMNRKKERPAYTILAAIVLLVVFSIPHSLFGSELNYESGQVTQGLILIFISKFSKKNLN